MKNFPKKFNDGFTLVETLVAVSIFTLSLLIVMVVLGQGLSNTTNSQEKTIATYLAQEGIEYMRNMRDTFLLYSTDATTGWTSFRGRLDACDSTSDSSKICIFDPEKDSSGLAYDLFAPSSAPQEMGKIYLAVCGSTCPTIKYDSATGAYGYTTGADSGYLRTITVKTINATEIKVISTVSWRQGSGTYTANFSENLYNWIE